MQNNNNVEQKILPIAKYSHFQFNEPFSLVGDGQEIIGIYKNKDIKYEMTRTQIRATNLFGNPSPYQIVLNNSQTYFDFILSHLTFPSWREILEPHFEPYKGEIENLLSGPTGNFIIPKRHMILNAFNMVPPHGIKFIIVGMRPRQYGNPHASPGINLLHTMAKSDHDAKHMPRLPWEEIFAKMFWDASDDHKTNVDTTLSFFLLTGDILLINLILTIPSNIFLEKGENDNLDHYKVWVRPMANFIKSFVDNNPQCTVIAIGQVVYTTLLAVNVNPDKLYLMQNPIDLGKKKISTNIVHANISKVLNQSGLRIHLAEALKKYEEQQKQ